MLYLMWFKVFMLEQNLVFEELYPTYDECIQALQHRLDTSNYNYEEVEIEARCTKSKQRQ